MLICQHSFASKFRVDTFLFSYVKDDSEDLQLKFSKDCSRVAVVNMVAISHM